MDNYPERVKALGLPDSNSNYIKSLWKEHCRDITGLEFTDNEEDNGEEYLVQVEASNQQDPDYLSSILKAINAEPERIKTGKHNPYEEQQWLEQKLTILARLKSQIELRLRNNSAAHEDS